MFQLKIFMLRSFTLSHLYCVDSAASYDTKVLIQIHLQRNPVCNNNNNTAGHEVKTLRLQGAF